MLLDQQRYVQQSHHDNRSIDGLAYWKEYLAQAPALLELSTDHPRLPVQSEQIAESPVHFSGMLRHALNDLSQKQGVPLFITMLAAFQVLIHRYCGQDDIVTGILNSDRVRNMAGNGNHDGATILALRSNLANNPRFSSFLQHVHATTSAAYAHGDVPYEQVLEALQIQRDPSYHPLFQVVFVLHGAGIDAHQRWSLMRPILDAVDRQHPQVDIALEIMDSAEGLGGQLTYRQDLFHETTIRRMIDHFQTLLEGIVDNPTGHIADLPLLTDVEQEQLLITWNRGSATSVAQTHGLQDLCVHHMVEDRAEQTPGMTAVVSGAESITYADLNQRANQLAHHLRSLGVGPEMIVGLCLERSVELIVGMLGILKAGAAYLPLDPTYPKDRIAFILADARISIVLTQQRLTSICACSTVICLDSDWATIAQADRSRLLPRSHPQHLSYVIYTSGSTGQPKGVQIQHSTLMNLVAWHCRAYAVTSSDRATLLAGLGFDAAVWEIWPYLATGASLYLPAEAVRTSPHDLLRWLIEHQITMCFMPTPLAELLIHEQWPAETAVRLLLVGGDKLQHYPRSGLPFTVVNNYGPTENTVVTTWNMLSASDDPGSPPIGRPIDHVQVYVLDRYFNPVPVGVPGELCIGGASLSRGYLSRPDLTAERFIPHPFLNPGAEGPTGQGIGGGRLYRTGDLVRYLPDGNLIFLRRMDTQVKIRGFRIELGEIEAVLSHHPSVRAAVVIDREDSGGIYLAAYIIPAEASSPSVEDLQQFLHTRLPEYMVPARYAFLEAFPLTPNGKVNRRELPLPHHAATSVDGAEPGVDQLASDGQAALDNLTVSLCEIWEDVLQMKTRAGRPVGVDDDFLQIGGDSIQAIHLVLALGSNGIEIGVSDIFRYRTIRALCSHLRSR